MLKGTEPPQTHVQLSCKLGSISQTVVLGGSSMFEGTESLRTYGNYSVGLVPSVKLWFKQVRRSSSRFEGLHHFELMGNLPRLGSPSQIIVLTNFQLVHTEANTSAHDSHVTIPTCSCTAIRVLKGVGRYWIWKKIDSSGPKIALLHTSN